MNKTLSNNNGNMSSAGSSNSTSIGQNHGTTPAHNNSSAMSSGGISNNNNSTVSTNDSKKEEFRRYLEKTHVLDALTKVLVGLYEEPERPPNAIDYIRKYMGAPPNVDVEALQNENMMLHKKVEQLTRQLEAVTAAATTVGSAPVVHSEKRQKDP
jgi:hypothetical protein